MELKYLKFLWRFHSLQNKQIIMVIIEVRYKLHNTNSFLKSSYLSFNDDNLQDVIAKIVNDDWQDIATNALNDYSYFVNFYALSDKFKEYLKMKMGITEKEFIGVREKRIPDFIPCEL